MVCKYSITFTQSILQLKVVVAQGLSHQTSHRKLPILVGPLSAIQPFRHPLTFKFPWPLGYIRRLAFGSPWGSYFTPGFVCSQHTAPRNIKLAQCHIALSRYQFTPWSSGASEIHFLCFEIFTLGRCRNRTTNLNLQSDMLPLDQCTPLGASRFFLQQETTLIAYYWLVPGTDSRVFI